MNAPVKPSKLIKGATGDWEMVIGLEIHAQVTSHAKLFSGSSTEFGGAPNSHVSLVDAAMPGMLPVINEACVKQAVRTGLGLNAQINLRSTFDRKNYFYPDLPQGYQISQYKSPIVGEGEVVIETADGEAVTIGIERLHLEQDAGKLLHDQSPTQSFVDLNRSGVALMEIVSKPDMRTSEQAQAYVSKLRTILRYLGTCDGDMEKGNLRADCNVSVRRPGEALGTRCEIKNVNSIRFIGQAIDHEARRQIGILEDGGSITQETRLYDPNKGETRSMRSKEEAHDYRYFPDPDLLPLEFSEAYVAELKSALPELPDEKKARFIDGFSLTPVVSERLTRDRELALKFEEQLFQYVSLADGAEAANLVHTAYGPDALTIKAKSELEFVKNISAAEPYFHTLEEGAYELSNLILGSVLAKCNEFNLNAADQIDRLSLAKLVRLTTDKTISSKIAKDLFEIVWTEGGDPRVLVEERGMKQVTDMGAIEKVVDDIIAANPDKVAQAQAKPALMGWFVGQVMKSSGGKANPQAVNDILKSKLGI
jgi:aspartyl-tRNA(Asn)/glutamyl-tRNA(Gln) amidotransferase subunit B